MKRNCVRAEHGVFRCICKTMSSESGYAAAQLAMGNVLYYTCANCKAQWELVGGTALLIKKGPRKSTRKTKQ